MTLKEWEEKCADIKARFSDAISAVAAPGGLDALKVSFLGRAGELTLLLKSLKDFPLEERKTLGAAGNALKTELTAIFDAKAAVLGRAALEADLQKSSADLTLPPYPFPRGRVHPLTMALREMTGILSRMGFARAEGPCVETEFNNFGALNFPEDHPAREMHDTLYVKTAPGADKLLLRTHTSPVQIRYMLSHKPPLRVMAPGRCFRNDAMDASHSPVFHQIEGLYVDKNVGLSDLKATLTQFMTALFKKEAEIRFRPSFFPFVEPGVEVDVKCVFCGGVGQCSVCKSTGWIEMLGAGVVHPNVLKSVGMDPEIWSGFAFGMGIERLAMLMYGIKDIRAFYENDIRVLSQFRP
ncbi:MAG: phenylalanine--tRNA ligase subunit alpha [Elusimicrobiales bacterium]|nr:phenylalanine--tRNA ligase subunit alpha [Elusimicrobiales bacterium]